MKYALVLVATIVMALMVTNGTAQVTRFPGSTISATALDPALIGPLGALASGDVVAGPALVEATGPQGNTNFYFTRFGGAVIDHDVVLTVVNVGDIAVQINDGPSATPILTVQPGESQSVATRFSVNAQGFAWEAPGTGSCQFLWAIKRL